MRSLQATLGRQTQEEYALALFQARHHIDTAATTADPAVARAAIRDARAALGRADTRLAAHAAPPA